MNKYKVKEGCRVEHNNQPYESGEIVELDSELALFHAANIEVIKQEKNTSTTNKKSDSNAE